jgi:hypothetical protein
VEGTSAQPSPPIGDRWQYHDIRRNRHEELLWSRTVGSASRFLPQPGKGGHWYFWDAPYEHHSGLPTPGRPEKNPTSTPFDTKTVHNLIRIVDRGRRRIRRTKVTLNNEKAVVEVRDDGGQTHLPRDAHRGEKIRMFDN